MDGAEPEWNGQDQVEGAGPLISDVCCGHGPRERYICRHCPLTYNSTDRSKLTGVQSFVFFFSPFFARFWLSAMFHNLTSTMTTHDSFTRGLSDLHSIGFSIFSCQRKEERGGEPRKGCFEADETENDSCQKRDLQKKQHSPRPFPARISNILLPLANSCPLSPASTI